MEPIKGKPEIPIHPTSQSSKKGSGIFFLSSNNNLSFNQNTDFSTSELKTEQIIDYVLARLKIDPKLLNKLPHSELFRQVLAKVVLELQFSLDDSRLQNFVLKLIHEQKFPQTSFQNPTSLETILRFLGSIVSLELDELSQEESFVHLLQYLTGHHIERNSDSDALLSFLQYKGRSQDHTFWWEWHSFELSNGYEGRFQFLFGPNKNLPHKIVAQFPHPTDKDKQLSFMWIEPDRQVIDLIVSETFYNSEGLNDLKKILVKNLQKLNFLQVHESVQFPFLSAESNTKEEKWGNGLNIFG